MQFWPQVDTHATSTMNKHSTCTWNGGTKAMIPTHYPCGDNLSAFTCCLTGYFTILWSQTDRNVQTDTHLHKHTKHIHTWGNSHHFASCMSMWSNHCWWHTMCQCLLLPYPSQSTFAIYTWPISNFLVSVYDRLTMTDISDPTLLTTGFNNASPLFVCLWLQKGKVSHHTASEHDKKHVLVFRYNFVLDVYCKHLLHIT